MPVVIKEKRNNMAFKMKGFEPHNMYKTEKQKDGKVLAEIHLKHLKVQNLLDLETK